MSQFISPFGKVPFGRLPPFVIIDGAAHAGAATASGAAAVKIEATGALHAGAATTSGAGAVKVAASGAMQATGAHTTGTVFEALWISASIFAGPASLGGIYKAPLETAAKAPYGAIHLVELEALERNLTRTALQWAVPFGMTAFGRTPVPNDSSGLVEFGFSDKGYISPPTGTKANTIFLGRVTQALRVSRSLPVAPEMDRRVNIEAGQIILANTDGALDSASELSVDGRPITVKLGLDDYAYDDFKPVFSGRSVSWVPDFTELAIDIRDETYLLDVELHPDFYDGSGGYNGSAQLAGKPRPCAFGLCRNVSPAFVDTANLIYQVHHRQIQAVDAVYDRRVALVAGADYASYAALVAASVAGGHFATCLALGLVKLGSSATLLTADIRGDAHGSYTATTAGIAQRLLLDYGGLDSADLDATLWTELASLAPGTVGWYLPDKIDISDAISQVVGGAGAWWGADFDGLIGADILTAPDTGNVVFDFLESHIRDITRLQPPSGTFPPRWRQTVGYQRNWTPMSGSDVAGSVTDSDKAFVTQEYRLVTSSDDDTRTEFLTSIDGGQMNSGFDSASDAQAVSDRVIDLLGTPRQTIQITVGLVGYMAPAGKTVTLTHPRINGGNGWLARVIDADVDAEAQQIVLVLWG